MTSPLGIRARIKMIGRGCELEISGTLLTVDLRIMDMSKFDVILGMDWLIAYRIVIDCECRRVTAYTQDGTRMVFQGDKHDVLPQTVYESKCQGQLAGWLASLILEDEVRPDLDLPRVVCEYEDVFPDELPGLPPHRDVDFSIELHPGTSPISMTPHRMALVELQELRVQLQELLDKGFFRPSTLMSLKVIYFQSIFLIDFYIKKTDLYAGIWDNFTKLLCSREFKRKQKLQ